MTGQPVRSVPTRPRPRRSSAPGSWISIAVFGAGPWTTRQRRSQGSAGGPSARSDGLQPGHGDGGAAWRRPNVAASARTLFAGDLPGQAGHRRAGISEQAAGAADSRRERSTSAGRHLGRSPVRRGAPASARRRSVRSRLRPRPRRGLILEQVALADRDLQGADRHRRPLADLAAGEIRSFTVPCRRGSAAASTAAPRGPVRQ